MIDTHRPMCAPPEAPAKPLSKNKDSVPGNVGADAFDTRDELLAFLGHELRTPLSAALSGIAALRRAEKDPTTASLALDLIERQLCSMTRVVDDILNYSRAALGKVEVRREHVDLARLVRTVADDHLPVMNEACLKLAVETPSTPLWTVVDPDRIAQILNNLLDNAIKFTDEGGSVTVRLEASADRRQALLAICDTGVGIDLESLPRIFDLFAQARRTSARSRSGLGLGLALVKGLVELHGGDVRVESKGPGCGSTFLVRLPLLGTEKERTEADDEPVPAPAEPRANEGNLCLFSWRNEANRN
jgi:signal transduction histidine kinase